MSSPAHSANPAGATRDAVLLGFFRPPRRSLFVMHLPGREPHREPHTLTFFTIATSSNAPSEGNPRSPHREGLKADPSTMHRLYPHVGSRSLSFIGQGAPVTQRVKGPLASVTEPQGHSQNEERD